MPIPESTERLRRRIEREVTPRVRRALLRQGRDIIRELQRADSIPELQKLADEIDEVEATRRIYSALYTVAVAAFGNVVWNQMLRLWGRRPGALPMDDLDPSREPPSWEELADTFVNVEGASLIRDVAASTKREVQRIIRVGVAQGNSIDIITADIRRAWPGIARFRARAIARTETLRASSIAGFQSAVEMQERFGLIVTKTWVDTEDDRTRTTHIEAADNPQNIGIGLFETFTVGTESALFPRDPRLSAAESIQCRCTAAYRAERPEVNEPENEQLPGEVIKARDPELVERDARIKRKYAERGDEKGEVAKFRIAEEECCSYHTVHSVLYR